MDHQKKVLILYASAGHGHEKAARAILEATQESSPGQVIGVFDTLEIIPPFWGHLYRKIYYNQIKYTPWLWGFFLFLHGHRAGLCSCTAFEAAYQQHRGQTA